MKVHKGDTVLVIAGKDKGAKGKVIQAYPATDKVLVEGVNRIKKHTAFPRTSAEHPPAASSRRKPRSTFPTLQSSTRTETPPAWLPHRRRVRQARSDFPEEREGHLT